MAHAAYCQSCGDVTATLDVVLRSPFGFEATISHAYTFEAVSNAYTESTNYFLDVSGWTAVTDGQGICCWYNTLVGTAVNDAGQDVNIYSLSSAGTWSTGMGGIGVADAEQYDALTIMHDGSDGAVQAFVSSSPHALQFYILGGANSGFLCSINVFNTVAHVVTCINAIGHGFSASAAGSGFIGGVGGGNANGNPLLFGAHDVLASPHTVQYRKLCKNALKASFPMVWWIAGGEPPWWDGSEMENPPGDDISNAIGAYFLGGVVDYGDCDGSSLPACAEDHDMVLLYPCATGDDGPCAVSGSVSIS